MKFKIPFPKLSFGSVSVDTRPMAAKIERIKRKVKPRKPIWKRRIVLID